MLKEDASVLFSVEAFDIFSQGGDLESCGGFCWEDLLEKPDGLSDCEPDSCAHVRVVPVVTDVLVSPSSVVTEFCDGVALMVNLWNRSPFLSPKSVLAFGQLRRK